MIFKDRFDAGKQLADALSQYKDKDDVVILAIPRGALQIGYVLSKELHAPLDVVFSKKIGAPGQEEFAIGAVTSEDVVINPMYEAQFKEYIDQKVKEIRETLRERSILYRKGNPPIDLKDKVVIVTDDGIATGRTLLMTLDLIKKQKPKKVIIAIPVAPLDTLDDFKGKVDEIVCLATPEPFYSIGRFYNNFAQVTDDEAIDLLQKANE